MDASIVPVAVIVEDGRILLTQRMPHARFPFTWECPGGKIEEYETPEKALRREVFEELGLEEVIIKGILAETPADAPGMHGDVIVRYYAVQVGGETAEMNAAIGMGWFTPYELEHLNVTPSLVIERKKISRYIRLLEKT